MKRSEKIMVAVSFVLVGGFFGALYFLMSLTGEDLNHQIMSQSHTPAWLFNHIYTTLPRLGEIYQWQMMRFYTYQASWGMDTVARLLNVAMAVGSVLLTAKIVLQKKMRFNLMTGLVVILSFIGLLTMPIGEVFMARFSHVHNYILALVLSLAVVSVFLREQTAEKSRWWQNLGIGIVGFGAGCATEIFPVCLMLMVGGNLIYQKIVKREKRKYTTLLVSAVVGVILGMIFFHAGNSFALHLNDGYAEGASYLSPLAIFSLGLITFARNYLGNLALNGQWLIGVFALMSGYTLVEWELARREKKVENNYWWWQTNLLIFNGLFLLAASQIVFVTVYPRIVIFVWVAFLIATLLIVKHLIEVLNFSEVMLRIMLIGSLLFGMLMTVDMLRAFIPYHKTVAQKLENVRETKSETFCVEAEELKMTPSLFFNFGQFPTFEEPAQTSLYKHQLIFTPYCSVADSL